MTITQIENNITKLLKNFSQDIFVFEFLLAYGEPKATISRLKKGDLNQLESKGELTQRKKLFFKEVTANLHGVIDTLRIDSVAQKQKPRFIVVTDYKTLLAYDTKTTDTLDIKFKDLAKHYDFFLPLAGMEKSQIVDENPADVKAAEKMAKLYDEITKENETQTDKEVHSLNVFLTRLLFCYFAEDSNIFQDNQFTNAIEQHTQSDGSDLDDYLERLFDLLNVEKREASLPEYLKAFPYVNGGLFAKHCHIPKFTVKSRRIMIEIGSLDWSEINPDIFGSMIQAVITPEHRGGLGMHYTSVPNIMKVIEPLFLDDLYEAFEKAKASKKKLQELLNRIAKLKIFDPACGSGNFLIIAYKELRRLEMKILSAMDDLSSQRSFAFSEIKLTQFYGIELDDFAHEVAILSLWLAEHQMNLEFYKAFGRTSPALPLKGGGNIVHGNATRIDWEEVCPKEDGDEIYILGNPPYLGGKLQNKDQKNDVEIVLKQDFKKYKNIDYIGCWFFKGAKYIDNSFDIKVAFVSTNSISQGTQVNDLWPNIFSLNIQINFAVTTFQWTNNAKSNAGVSVVIIGLSHHSQIKKYIYTNSIKKNVENINAYLLDAPNVFIEKRTQPLSKLPRMTQGNIPLEQGLLRLNDMEKNELVNNYPESQPLLKKATGSQEALNNELRWCLWINNETLALALSIPPIKERIDEVRKFRLAGATNAQATADRPHTFVMTNMALNQQLVIPIVSSERRKYIPISLFDNSYIVMNSALVIYDPEVYILGILSSTLHRIWASTFAGKLESRLRYSVGLCWYSFPFPYITEKQKADLTELVFNILDEREQHSEKTLAQLYDPDKMPDGLREAHHQLDLAIERCYRKKPFESEEERLEYLFKLYEEMIKAEGKN